MRSLVPRALVFAICLTPLATASPAQAQGAMHATRHVSFVPDAILVQRSIWFINAQLPPARLAVDRAAANEFRTLIILAITGASDADILAYSGGTPLRLSAAGAVYVDRAYSAVDATFATLRQRHGSVPSQYSEPLTAAAFMLTSDIQVRIRERWGAIDSLASWLTR